MTEVNSSIHSGWIANIHDRLLTSLPHPQEKLSDIDMWPDELASGVRLIGQVLGILGAGTFTYIGKTYAMHRPWVPGVTVLAMTGALLGTYALGYEGGNHQIGNSWATCDGEFQWASLGCRLENGDDQGAYHLAETIQLSARCFFNGVVLAALAFCARDVISSLRARIFRDMVNPGVGLAIGMLHIGLWQVTDGSIKGLFEDVES